MTFFRASKSNKYTFAPFWSLSTISIFGSFIVWNIFKEGILGFNEEKMPYLAVNAFQASMNILLQIIIAISLILLFDKHTNSHTSEKIAFWISRHKIYKKSVTIATNIIMRFAKAFDTWSCQIAHAWNVDTFKELYHAGSFLKMVHVNYLQNHVVWILFGLTLCLIFVFVEKGLG